MKTYDVGTHKKRLGKALLMSTHNICFHGGIRKISINNFWLEKKKKKKKHLIWSYGARISVNTVLVNELLNMAYMLIFLLKKFE